MEHIMNYIKETIGGCTLYQGDNQGILPELGAGSIDAIVTDPPYCYLKQDFDRRFDESTFFIQCKRVLSETGFIAQFGRGASFYQRNVLLAGLGFSFKEEIIWNKRYVSSPFQPIKRSHETMSIYGFNGNLRSPLIPYLERKRFDIASLKNDIKRILSLLGSRNGMEKVLDFVENGFRYEGDNAAKFGVTRGALKRSDIGTYLLESIEEGVYERTVMEVSMNRFIQEHPTQKPERLMERIIALVSDAEQTILDPFMGSGTTGVACVNTGRKFIGIELNEKYFDIAVRRIGEARRQETFHFG
jgi:site-specific DNA-methyltransferase (adenine-specific)